MPPNEPIRRDEILEAALSAQPGERQEIVDRACEGDPELRLEVLSLLRVSSEMEEGFMETTPASPASSEGGWMLGRFQVERMIGRGGMSSVYRAWDTKIQRVVAVKVGTIAAGTGEGTGKYAVGEVRALGRLSHPNIVRIYDCGEFKDMPYLVMEFLEGEDLSKAIPGKRCGTLEDRIFIARQIAIALSHIHGADILHRDIKPGNIFLQPGYAVKLMDFGISRPLTDAAVSNTFAGTLQYMSPELLSREPVTHLSDIYGWGVVAYELFTGRLLDADVSVAGIVQRALNDSLPEDPLLQASVPRAIVQLILDATARDPGRRPCNADELLRRLNLASQSPSSSHGLTVTRPLRRRLAAALAFGTILLGAGGIAARWLPSSPRIEALRQVPPKPAPAPLPETAVNRTEPEPQQSKSQQPKSDQPKSPPSDPSQSRTFSLAPDPAQATVPPPETRRVPAMDDPAMKDAAVEPVHRSAEANPGPPSARLSEPPPPTESAEDRDWNLIRQNPNMGALRAFLTAYPNGKYGRRAKEAAAKLEYEAIRNPPYQQESLDRFARQYPEHPFAASAASIRRQLELRVAESAAIDLALQQYAAAFQSGKIEQVLQHRVLTRDQRKKIESQFHDARKIEMTLVATRPPAFVEPVSADPQFAGKAPVTAAVRAEQRMRVVYGNGTVHPSNEQLTVQLRRTENRWMITSFSLQD